MFALSTYMESQKEINELLSTLRKKVLEKGNEIREFKKIGADDEVLKKAISELKLLKKNLEAEEAALMPQEVFTNRTVFEDVVKQRFIYDQSFSIHGGVQGLYDMGPYGCAIEANLLKEWRHFFIEEEQMLEVRCSALTPERVLKTSGHVERFADIMVKDVISGDCYRADHLISETLKNRLSDKGLNDAEKQQIERIISQVDNFDESEIESVIKQYNIKATNTGNELSSPMQFNLMFDTSIGPVGTSKGYLRPETAQGIFVNFQRLLQVNQGKLPFAAAQIGSAFRNEISPRCGLLRAREFMMAEIEHFLDPADKSFAKFHTSGIADLTCTLFSACNQMDGKSSRRMSLKEAVYEGIIANETLAYYMGRIYLFLLHIGIKDSMCRFRQHLSNEMAHYACDCWDAECLTSYGWIECVGCADRSCYDLKRHADVTGTRLCVNRGPEFARKEKQLKCVVNKKHLGQIFKKDCQLITNYLIALKQEEIQKLHSSLNETGSFTMSINDQEFELLSSMVFFKEEEVTVNDDITPNVIEPSFGIGRVMYSALEQNFCVREHDDRRTFFSLPTCLAPYKCSLLPLSNTPVFEPFIAKISSLLVKHRISHRIDKSSGTIGRRYARTDQIGIPFGITIDFDTVNKVPASVTLRERDSMEQIRLEIDKLPTTIDDLSSGALKWKEALQTFGAFAGQETYNN